MKSSAPCVEYGGCSGNAGVFITVDAPSFVDNFHAVLFRPPIFDLVIKRERGMERGKRAIHKEMHRPNTLGHTLWMGVWHRITK